MGADTNGYVDSHIRRDQAMAAMMDLPWDITPYRARAILLAEGNWPRRHRSWPREEAECDIFALAAFGDLWSCPGAFQASFREWLR